MQSLPISSDNVTGVRQRALVTRTARARRLEDHQSRPFARAADEISEALHDSGTDQLPRRIERTLSRRPDVCHRSAARSTPAPNGAVPTRRAVIALLAEERHVRTVRHFAAAHLSCWGLTDQDRDCVVLIVGELADSAVRHGGKDMTVSLSLTNRDVCIDFVDTGPSDRPPPLHCTEAEDEHGRGLRIVGHLAHWTDFRAERDGWRCRVGLRVAPA